MDVAAKAANSLGTVRMCAVDATLLTCRSFHAPRLCTAVQHLEIGALEGLLRTV